MIDFAQESGRAGQDLKPAKSIVLLNQSRDKCEPEFSSYCMSGLCRRFTLSSYLDWLGIDCWAGENELCDICISNSPGHRPNSRTSMRTTRKPSFRVRKTDPRALSRTSCQLTVTTRHRLELHITTLVRRKRHMQPQLAD